MAYPYLPVDSDPATVRPWAAVSALEEIAAQVQELAALAFLAATSEHLQPATANAMRGIASLASQIHDHTEKEHARFAEAFKGTRLIAVAP